MLELAFELAWYCATTPSKMKSQTKPHADFTQCSKLTVFNIKLLEQHLNFIIRALIVPPRVH